MSTDSMLLAPMVDYKKTHAEFSFQMPNLGDKAFIMIPRVPAWYDVMIGCCKAAIVAMPGTNLLTAKDIAYRVNKAGARIALWKYSLL